MLGLMLKWYERFTHNEETAGSNPARPTKSKTKMINIKGLNKAQVLMLLYNASKVQGMGFLQATGKPMTLAEADEIVESTLDFDYLHGKVMKVDLSKDEFNPRLYDRDNGDGAAARALESILTK